MSDTAALKAGDRVRVIAKDDAACVDYGTVLHAASGGWRITTDHGKMADYPFADVTPLTPEEDAQRDPPRSGNRVVLVAPDRVMPIGSTGEVIDEHLSGAVIVRFDGPQIEMGYMPSDLRVIREAAETVMERLRKRLAAPPSPDPVQYHPPVIGARSHAAPAPCCAAGACVPTDEDDDSIPEALRDIVASQMLAMATARTRSALSIAAMAVLTQARGAEIAAAIRGGLRSVLASVGDAFDGVDLDALTRQVMAKYGVPMAEESVTVVVEVNGATIGTVTVPANAPEPLVIEAIRGDALLMAKITGEVTRVEYVAGKVVRVTTT